jgi:putative nucleotidyltransferase with HDIG domain
VNLWRQIERVTAPAEAGPDLRYHATRLALALILALVTYLLFPASPAVEFPLLEVGSVAPDNVIAPFAYTVSKPEADLRKERDDLARTVEPIFTYSEPALDSTRQAVRRFGDLVSAAADEVSSDSERAAAIVRAAADAAVTLTPQEGVYLASPVRRRALISGVSRVFERWLGEGVASSGALDNMTGRVMVRRGVDEHVVIADSIPTFGSLVTRARIIHPDAGSAVGDGLYLKLLGAFFHPTLVSDKVATERRRQDLRRTVESKKYDVRAGEKIVGAHEVVGREENEKMRVLRDELQNRRGAQRALGRVIGAVLFNALVIALFGITLLLFRPQLYRSIRALSLVAIVFLFVLIAAAFISHTEHVHPELIPIAFAAIIVSVLFDPRISVIAAMILAVLIGGQSVFRGTNALFINLIAGVVAAFSVRGIRRRTDVFYSVLTVAAAYLLAAVAIGLTLDQPLVDIGRSAGLGAISAAVSAAVAMALVPAAEELTGIETYQRLLEWSDLNRPLMQRLMLEAPGTFEHTIRIANLTEAACNAIGANGLLGRVGAYYHDIGKLKKPQYFVENQQGRNPHDKLKPQTSATIIRNHVREGMELADEYRLPKAVAAFITEHHGTGQISYFLEKAKERDGEPGNPSDYVYPGPVPQTAETAVCMLADGVEAASRVVSEPTPEKIRAVIDHIVKQRIDQGQLRAAPLTLKQIETVKDQFARVLTGAYHHRTDYPAASGGITSEFASAATAPYEPRN